MSKYFCMLILWFIYPHALCNAESEFMRYQRIYDGSPAPTIAELATEGVWTRGEIASRFGNKVANVRLAVFRERNASGQMKTFSIMLAPDVLDYRTSSAQALQFARTNRGWPNAWVPRVHFSGLWENQELNALAQVFYVDRLESSTLLMRKARTINGDPAVLIKHVCIDREGCGAFAGRHSNYGETIEYQYFTNYEQVSQQTGK